MLMDIIVIIILFGIGYVIVDTITAIKNARHKSNLPEVAKNASETKKIISCLKSASTAKVVRVECRLSINSAEYPGVIEVIQVDMKLTCPELVPRYAALKEEYRQAVRSQVTAEVNGDHLYASQMNKKQNELRQELKKVFLSRFVSELDAQAIVGPFSDMEDTKVDLANNTIAAFEWIFVKELRDIAKKYNRICSPYIFDAVAEAAKDIPNISLTIDKTIPTKKK